MKCKLADQITRLHDDCITVENFDETVIKGEKHEVERIFRDRGKYHESVVGPVSTGVESMDCVVGGPLHNEIGIGNDLLDQLMKELAECELNSVCDEIKQFLNTSKAEGGAGCTPGQAHGGKYNGESS